MRFPPARLPHTVKAEGILMFTPYGFGIPGIGFTPWGFGAPLPVGIGGPGPTAGYTPFGFGATAGRTYPPPYAAGASMTYGGMGAGFGIW